jgi:DNA-binding transcriptional regulator GbsR (MarR family)
MGEAEARFLAVWEDLAPRAGLPPAHGRILGLLFLSPRPLDAESLEKRLGISHGSCSTGLRDLVDRGFVRRLDVPGLRRAKFATDPDGWRWLRRALREWRRDVLGPLAAAAEEAAGAAGAEAARARSAGDPGWREAAAARDRVRAFAAFGAALSSLADAWLALEGPPPRRLLRALRPPVPRGPRKGGKP